jgi:hypothetical protein
MDYFSTISEAIRKASEAYVEALSTVNSAISNLSKGGLSAEDRERLVENWLRVARMSKDGIVTALEQGFELWERECRRMMAASKPASGGPVNPMEAWAENWKKAAEAFGAGAGWNEQARKQAEMVQKTLQEGLRAWQQLWEKPQKKD